MKKGRILQIGILINKGLYHAITKLNYFYQNNKIEIFVK